MKNAYPVLIKQSEKDFLVYIPDIDQFTEGKSLYDAIFMARDLLGTWSLSADLPVPSSIKKAREDTVRNADSEEFKWSDGLLTYVDIDDAAYRKKMDTRAVKKNCTVPAWLNEKAEEAGINFSRALQDALLEKLEIK